MSGVNHGRYSKIKSNNLDPDEGNSKLCSACKLPIFATPFIISESGAMQHDQCVDLPEELKAYDLHPEKPLLLRDNLQPSSKTCSQCSEECGTKFYSCPDPDSHCGLILDVACALPIKILHRSHLKHRVIAIRSHDKSCLGTSTCGVCGGKHEHGAWEGSRSSYICVVCWFWIHPECAALPNVIQHERHEHPLVLHYELGAALSGAVLAKGYDFQSIQLEFRTGDDFINHLKLKTTISCKCDICGLDDDAGIYSCLKCRGYFIHIKCASQSDHPSFTVVGRDVQFPNLIRLPILNEHLSFLEHTLKHSKGGVFANIEAEDPDVKSKLVCDICHKIIDKPTFYIGKEEKCPDLLFHHNCRNVPDFISSHPAHPDKSHPGLIITFSPHLTGHLCSHCRCPIGRIFYMCWWCKDENFMLDVSCALMPAVVTHDQHSSTHFLHLSENSGSRSCDCCGKSLGELGYECWTCPNFALHTWCAMLPKTITHKFDPHPLHLITTGVAEICEICENDMDNEVWYYGCKECDQWFHIDCIPCLDLVHKVKPITYYFSREPIPQVYPPNLNIPINLNHVLNHKMDIPARLIRGLTLLGYCKDNCRYVADEYDILPSD